jgi:hypothetical protein
MRIVIAISDKRGGGAQLIYIETRLKVMYQCNSISAMISRVRT